MRTRSKGRGFFHGTHKGSDIDIQRESDGRFYIIVTAPDGCHAYEGFAPETVRTIAEAKREARRGACLDQPTQQTAEA